MSCFLFISGFLLGSLIEYGYHRFVLHARRRRGRLKRSHQNHHRAVLVGTSNWLFSPLAPAAALSFVVGAWALWGGPGGWFWLWLGLGAYYFAFELVHWLVHRRVVPGWLGWHGRRHQLHHRYPYSYFNVVLPLGDWLLGARKRKSVEKRWGGSSAARAPARLFTPEGVPVGSLNPTARVPPERRRHPKL